MTEQRHFGRSFGSLQGIFAFSSDFLERHGLDRELLPTIDFAVEELFTNMVKYSPSGSDTVCVTMTPCDGGVEVTLTDYAVDRFDVTLAPDADTGLPIEERKPGGLGLHLIRRLVDTLQYQYSDENRESRITFRKTTAGRGNGDTVVHTGRRDARD